MMENFELTIINGAAMVDLRGKERFEYEEIHTRIEGRYKGEDIIVKLHCKFFPTDTGYTYRLADYDVVDYTYHMPTGLSHHSEKTLVNGLINEYISVSI